MVTQEIPVMNLFLVTQLLTSSTREFTNASHFPHNWLIIVLELTYHNIDVYMHHVDGMEEGMEGRRGGRKPYYGIVTVHGPSSLHSTAAVLQVKVEGLRKCT